MSLPSNNIRSFLAQRHIGFFSSRIAPWLCTFVASILIVGVSEPTSVLAAQPYKVVKSAAVGGTGGFDYVFADADGRKLYVPRGDRVDAFDLDTLKPVGTITPTNRVHGA